MNSYHSAVAVLAVIALVACAGAVLVSDESDAATHGSSSSPLTSLSSDSIYDYCGDTVYLEVGSRVSLPADTSDVYFYSATSVSSGYGLFLTGTPSSGQGVSGTVSKVGTITINVDCADFDVEDEWSETIRIIVVSSDVPVTSVSISGSTSVTVGSSITLSVSVSPSDATDKGITWSISSGSSYASITSQSDTSCIIKGVSAGSVTVKATADDGSGKSDTHTITVSNPSKSITLSFNANGGSGAPSSITKSTTSSSYTFTIPTTEPTRSGYDFLGWSKSSTASSPSYHPGGTISLSSGDTLYAVWEKEVVYYSHYLYYNANGGSGAPSTQSYSTTSSVSHTFTISTKEPTRSGYVFLGWSTSSSATTASYDPGDRISVSANSSKTLYAVWDEITHVSSISISGSSSVKVGSTLTLTATTSPTSADDRHVTWTITSGSSRVSYTTSDTSTGGKIVLTGISAGSVTVKATAADGSGVYKTKTITVSNNTYYLYYNANGGSGAPATQSYSGGTASTHAFTISSVEPTRSGYNFLGWSTSSSATAASYDSGDVISVSKNSSVTLYAVWQQVTYTSTLEYSANGGSGAPSTQTFTGTSTSDHVFTVSDTVPSKSGFIFLGWSTSSGASTASHQPGDTISVGCSGTVTLYAVWEAEEPSLVFTSVPDQDQISLPGIVYNDDGTYEIVAVFSVPAPSMLMSLSLESDSGWTDPNYREPPEADYVITVTDVLEFESDDPAYTLRWTLQDGSGASNKNYASYMTNILSLVYENYDGYVLIDHDSCLPSWIHWDSGLDASWNRETGYFELVIRPALQQVEANTEGDYWIFWEVEHPEGMFSKTTESFLLEFHVEVDWSGSVIIPEEYRMFKIIYDYGPDVYNANSENSVKADSDVTVCQFLVPTTAPDRVGYSFKGWSTVAGAETTNVGETFPLNINNADVRLSTDENGMTVYSMTLYAVWEKTGSEELVLPDFLQESLDLLSDPLVMVLFFVIVFVVALIVRNRKMGEW